MTPLSSPSSHYGPGSDPVADHEVQICQGARATKQTAIDDKIEGR